MDDIHWLPDWKERPRPETRAILEQRISADNWVISGNYTAHAEVIMPRVTMIVWLDHSLGLVTWRLTARTFRRLFLGERCCNGNRERFWAQLTRDGIFWFTFTTFYRRRRQCAALLADPSLAHIQRVRLCSSREVERFLKGLTQDFAIHASIRPTQGQETSADQED